MNIYPVGEALRPAGVYAPTLNSLVPDADNYSVLLLQPEGVVEATSHGIRSSNRHLARTQFLHFLKEVVGSQPDLAVTPEYSMPWEVLKSAIQDDNAGPATGKLWAFGCESIKYSELQSLQQELADVAKVIFEELVPDDDRFVDPLAYVFRAPTSQHNEETKLVVLVQFKTHPMVDPHDFERDLLQVGKRIYRFGNPGAGISLLTFICSDMLPFDDGDARAVHDRALILHIQLNPERQNPALLDFRGRLFRMGGKETEVLTLNWARGTGILLDGQRVPQTKFGGSAWYIKANEIDLSDGRVARNHRLGLYYTRIARRWTHAMFFNFAPAVYQLTASKVVRLCLPGAVAARRGLKMESSETWDTTQEKWTNTELLNDGFEAILNESGGAEAQVKASYDICPCACERLVAICAGDAFKSDGWYDPKNLGSFSTSELEMINRLTFCQPSHDDEVSYRLRRLWKCARLWEALSDTAELPLGLKDIADGFTLEWTSQAVNHNVRTHAGTRATVMHLGESNQEAAQIAYNMALRRVHASLPVDSAYLAKQCTAAWYFPAIGPRQLVYQRPRFDENGKSPVDILKES